MFHPFDQAFHQSRNIPQNEYPHVRYAPIIQGSQSNSNPIHTQETTRDPIFSEEDLKDPGWQDSESNNTVLTKEDDSIKRGRKFQVPHLMVSLSTSKWRTKHNAIQQRNS